MTLNEIRDVRCIPLPSGFAAISLVSKNLSSQRVLAKICAANEQLIPTWDSIAADSRKEREL
jgi:hypothetical protein